MYIALVEINFISLFKYPFFFVGRNKLVNLRGKKNGSSTESVGNGQRLRHVTSCNYVYFYGFWLMLF